jgi:hypothetical protein
MIPPFSFTVAGEEEKEDIKLQYQERENLLKTMRYLCCSYHKQQGQD